MLRLAILRDDLEYEMSRTGIRDGDPTNAWLSVYGLRKLAITVGEVKNIFSHDVSAYLQTVDWPLHVVTDFESAIAAVEDANDRLQPIRDALGAHVRPSNAQQPKVDPTPEVLRAHGQFEYDVTLDMETGSTTRFCGVTAATYLFVWAEVRTEEDYEKRRNALHPTILYRCFGSIRHGIDLIFAWEWQKRGLLKAAGV